MARDSDEKSALGGRLRAARTQAGYSLESAAAALTDAGYKIGKAGVGHWETGTNLPDALTLKQLAKIYEVSTDALLGLQVVMTTKIIDVAPEKPTIVGKVVSLKPHTEARERSAIGPARIYTFTSRRGK